MLALRCARPGEHIGNEEVTAAGSQGNRPIGEPVGGDHAAQLSGEFVDLPGAPGVREDEPVVRRRVARIAADALPGAEAAARWAQVCAPAVAVAALFDSEQR